MALDRTCFTIPICRKEDVFDFDVEFDTSLESYDRLREGLGGYVSLQCTTLYTTFFGERRLRIHNVDMDTRCVLPKDI